MPNIEIPGPHLLAMNSDLIFSVKIFQRSDQVSKTVRRGRLEQYRMTKFKILGYYIVYRILLIIKAPYYFNSA